MEFPCHEIYAVSQTAPEPGRVRRWNPFRILRIWVQRWQERQELAELSDKALKDIGVTRCEALREVWKPFWRA
nr:DUF1127 domain-containing protein [Roseococcus sp. MDT2-1-1]